MIERTSGNILASDAEALVNTVNTVGVMGKGIALQFKQAFPDNFKAYHKACNAEQVKTGEMFLFETGLLHNPKYIINFPTKQHWKGNSKMEYVVDGLENLAKIVQTYNIKSIAIPPLGCGLGGLNWIEVSQYIENTFVDRDDLAVSLYEPKGAPEVDEVIIATKRPNMTLGRAVLLSILNQYIQPGYRLSLLEVQKLAYLLQSAGEQLKLNFVKQQFGPYAENLNHVLQRIDGHFIRGYGDRSRQSSIRLDEMALDEAKIFLNSHENSINRIQRVTELIEGFETPYGLELLSTIHWLNNEKPDIEHNLPYYLEGFSNWNKRKKETFATNHIEIAFNHLNDSGWF